MEGLKIFLDTRVILLVPTLPVDLLYGDEVKKFDGSNSMVQIYSTFERNHSKTRLIFFGENFQEMQASFFSIFEYVEAAGGKITNENDEILVIFRYGKWDMPKGKINQKRDFIETPSEAALREVMEETGLRDIRLGKEIASTFHIFKHENKRILKRTYWFEMFAKSDQSLNPQIEEDISIVKWVAAEKMPEIRLNTYASLEAMFF